jgi:hypothetical protein
MSSKYCVVLSHVWITESQEYKKDIIDLVIKHFRTHNPDLYIILTGHGKPPYDKSLALCDFHKWSAFDPTETGKGHPKLVMQGLVHAQEQGFTRLLKLRADCIIAMNNIHQKYDTTLGAKRFLAKSEPKGLNDLLMYGDLDIFLDGWNIKAWDPGEDGVTNFTRTLNPKYSSEIITRDPDFLRWVYLDPYWEELCTAERQQDLLDNNFNYKEYLWGKASSLRAQSPAGINRNVI